MKRPRAGQPVLAWEQGPDGRWRAVRTRFVPRPSARTERARPLSRADDGAAQLAELAVVVDLFGVFAQRFGAAPTALALGLLLATKKKGRR